MWVVEDMQRDTVDRFASDRNGQDTFALGWLRTANECLCLPRMRFCQQQMLRAQLPQQGQLGAGTRTDNQRDSPLIRPVFNQLFEQRAHIGHGCKDRKSTRLNSSHSCASRMPSSACKKQTN